jgi:hypothetical protein
MKKSTKKKAIKPRIFMIEDDGGAQLSLHGEGKSGIFMTVRADGTPVIEMINADASRHISLSIGGRYAQFQIWDEFAPRFSVVLTDKGVIERKFE